MADEYLKYLYFTGEQDIAAQYFYRLRDAAVMKKYSSIFQSVKLFSIGKKFGGGTPTQLTQLLQVGLMTR